MEKISEYIKMLLASRRFRGLFRDAWSMGWPLICVMLFEFLIAITDVYIAGKIGKEVQGAVGFVNQVYFVFIVLANAITMGTVIVVSKLHGRKDRKSFSTAVYSVILSVVVSGFFIFALGYSITPFAIQFSSVPIPIKQIAVPFVKIYLAGLFFHYFLINSNGLLRATKQVRRSLVTMTIIMIVNVALNFIFLYHTSLGFRGIALSTVIGFTLGALLNLPPVLSMIRGHSSFDKRVMVDVIRVGWPTLVLQVSWQLGSVVLFLILSKLPEHQVEIMAAFTNGQRIEAVIFLPAYALNMAAAAMTGNLIGEGRKKDAYYGGFVMAGIGMAVIVALSALVILNARTLSGLLSQSPEVIHESVRYLVVQMIAEPFMAVLVILSGTLNGAGDTRGVMRVVVIAMWVVRVPFGYFFAIVLGFGPLAVWWVMNMDIIVRMFFILNRYRKRKWLKE
jgi:putative MATE family efflux protein